MSTGPGPPESTIPSGAVVYSVFGIRLATDHPMTFNLATGSSPADVSFSLVQAPPLPQGWASRSRRLAVSNDAFSLDRVNEVWLADDCVVVRFTAIADFFIWRHRIAAYLLDPQYLFAIEMLLFGTVLTLWLELQGVPTLHAASVEIEGHAIGFLATNKGGKSSLAASFMQRGARLLGDDLLPLEWRGGSCMGRPSYPQMRFWPEQAERLLGAGAAGAWPRVQPGSPKLRIPVGPGGFGEFCGESTPLAALYLPDRDAHDRVEIEPIGYGEALTQLVRHSFLAGVLEAMGLATVRFTAFARCLRCVSIRRLRYPSGIEHLEEVCDAVRSDVRRVRSA